MEPAWEKGWLLEVTEPKTYRVVLTREGNQWLADVEGVPGAHTYARALPTLLRYVREVIVLGEDVADDAGQSLVLDLDVHTGDDDVDQAAQRVRRMRAMVRSSTEELQEQTAATARRLVAAGWSVRDAATVLDIAPQRVSQLTSSVARVCPSRSHQFAHTNARCRPTLASVNRRLRRSGGISGDARWSAGRLDQMS